MRPASNESQSDRSFGNTSSSRNASSQTVSVLRRFPTALVCVGPKPSSLGTCATSNVRDGIRNETVPVCTVRCAIRTTRRSACRGHSDDSHPFLRWQGNAITKSNKSTGGGGHAFSRHQDAHQIERVGSGNSDALARGQEVAQRAERFHGDRQSELLPEKAADESSAADFSAILKAPQGDQQLAPRGLQGL